MAEAELDLLRGAALQAARIRRGLTQLRLSKLARVSRKHISDAEKGRNLSCDVLKKLMKTLELTEITFSDSTIRISSSKSDPAILVAVAETTATIANALDTIQAAVNRLQGVLDQNSRPAAQLNTKAASLIRNFTNHVRTRTPDELEDMEQAVVQIVRGDSRATASSRRRRRTA